MALFEILHWATTTVGQVDLFVDWWIDWTAKNEIKSFPHDHGLLLWWGGGGMQELCNIQRYKCDMDELAPLGHYSLVLSRDGVLFGGATHLHHHCVRILFQIHWECGLIHISATQMWSANTFDQKVVHLSNSSPLDVVKEMSNMQGSPSCTAAWFLHKVDPAFIISEGFWEFIKVALVYIHARSLQILRLIKETVFSVNHQIRICLNLTARMQLRWERWGRKEGLEHSVAFHASKKRSRVRMHNAPWEAPFALEEWTLPHPLLLFCCRHTNHNAN